MSIQFKPKEVFGKDETAYDAKVHIWIFYLQDKKTKADIVEQEIRKLDVEWAKQGES